MSPSFLGVFTMVIIYWDTIEDSSFLLAAGQKIISSFPTIPQAALQDTTWFALIPKTDGGKGTKPKNFKGKSLFFVL